MAEELRAEQYQRTLAANLAEPHCSDMSKRILATSLWFTVGWTFGSMATFFIGLPEGLNIASAAVLGAAIWWDPSHRLWSGAKNKPSRTSELLAGRRLATD